MNFPRFAPDIKNAVNCPNCRAEMNEREVNARPAHVCDRCLSVWIDGELTRNVFVRMPGMEPRSGTSVVEELRANDIPFTLRTCPSCPGETLDKTVWFEESPIVYDFCRLCEGVFLDAKDVDLQYLNLPEEKKENVPLINKMLMSYLFMAPKSKKIDKKDRQNP